MKLTDYIIRFENLIDPTLLQKIYSLMSIEDYNPMKVGGGNGGVIKDDIRNVQGFTIGIQTPITKENASRHILGRHLTKALSIVHLNYMMLTTRKPDTVPGQVVQIDFLKYGVGGKYEVHIDGGLTFRNVTTIINLNEEYEGGEFVFYNPLNRNEIMREEKLKTGSIICFPSTFLYPHSVRPITSGERRSLVCWSQ